LFYRHAPGALTCLDKLDCRDDVHVLRKLATLDTVEYVCSDDVRPGKVTCIVPVM